MQQLKSTRALEAGKVAPVPANAAPDGEIRVARSVEALAALEAPWRALQAEAQVAGVFSSWPWNHTVASCMAGANRLDVSLIVREGRPVALAPLAYRRIGGLKALVLLGTGLKDYSMADYQDVLVVPGQEEFAAGRLAGYLEDEAWDLVWFQEVPPSSPFIRPWVEESRRHGWEVREEPANDTYRVALPGTWEAYLESLSKNTRTRITRQLRKLEREHDARMTKVSSREDVQPALEALFDLHTRRWQKDGLPGIFGSEASRAIYRDLASRLFDEGRLALLAIEANGRPVGVILSFDVGGERSMYTLGYSPDEVFQSYSLGTLLDAVNIRDAIAGGLTSMDLMRGHGEYKRQYNATRSDNTNVFVFRTPVARWRYDTYRKARRFAGWVRRRLRA